MEGVKKQWEPINFVFYASFVKWPVLLAIIAEVVLRLFLSGFWEDLPLDRVDLYLWPIRILAFIYIGWKIGKFYGEVPPMGALGGAVAGLLIGFFVSLFRFVGGFHTWKIFNIITESALTILVGSLTVFLVVYLWDFLPQKVKDFNLPWLKK